MNNSAEKLRLNAIAIIRSLQTNEVLKVKLIRNGWNATGENEKNGYVEVSDAAPLGRALLGKQRGEVAIVEAPAGVFAWEIVEVLNGG